MQAASLAAFRIVYVAVLMLAATAAAADTTSALTAGKPAPPCMPSQILHGGDEVTTLTAEKLRGKAVVLDFWATWCGPCIESMPHLNALIAEFKDQPVQFLAITDEESTHVKQFLKRTPIACPVGIDAEGTIKRAYGVSSIPRMILIDSSGKIAGVTHPANVTTTIVQTLLAGGKIELPVPRQSSGREMPRFETEPSTGTQLEMRISVVPEAQPYGTQLNSAEYLGREKLSFWLSQAYDHDVRLIRFPDGSDPVVDVMFRKPGGMASLKAYNALTSPTRQQKDAYWKRIDTIRKSHMQMIKGALPVSLDLNIRYESLTTDVIVLTAPHGLKDSVRPHEPPTTSMSRNRTVAGSANVVNEQPGYIARTLLDRFLRIHTVDETGDLPRSDFKLTWDPGRPESLKTALKEQLGLDARTETRTLQLMIVERTD